MRSVIDRFYTQVTNGHLERYHHKGSLQLPPAFISVKEIREATPKVTVLGIDWMVRIDLPVISPELSKSGLEIFARDMSPKNQLRLGLQKELAPITHPDQGPKDFLPAKGFFELDANLANIYRYA